MAILDIYLLLSITVLHRLGKRSVPRSTPYVVLFQKGRILPGSRIVIYLQKTKSLKRSATPYIFLPFLRLPQAQQALPLLKQEELRQVSSSVGPVFVRVTGSSQLRRRSPCFGSRNGQDKLGQVEGMRNRPTGSWVSNGTRK